MADSLTFLWYMLRIFLWQGDVWEILWLTLNYIVKAQTVHRAGIFLFDLLLQVSNTLFYTEQLTLY